jgi:hypothetical protein
MAPYNQDNVGIFDVFTAAFSTLAINQVMLRRVLMRVLMMVLSPPWRSTRSGGTGSTEMPSRWGAR